MSLRLAFSGGYPLSPDALRPRNRLLRVVHDTVRVPAPSLAKLRLRPRHLRTGDPRIRPPQATRGRFEGPGLLPAGRPLPSDPGAARARVPAVPEPGHAAHRPGRIARRLHHSADAPGHLSARPL